MFFTCVEGLHKQLAPLYKYCVKRIYPDEHVEVMEIKNAACQRFLMSRNEPFVHITDADILLLPHEQTHTEYYSKYMVKGASYLRGCTVGGGKKWEGKDARICGGHVLFTPEFYKSTVEGRFKYGGNIDGFREFDEIMLARILSESGYPIPKDPYTFHDGTPWDKEYRDLHLQDFISLKYLKWLPSKTAIRELLEEDMFRDLIKDLDSYWRTCFNIVKEYVYSLEEHPSN